MVGSLPKSDKRDDNEVVRGTLALMVPQVLTVISSYAIQLFLAWYFLPSDYGSFFVVISFVFLLSFLLNTGIPQAVSKTTAENEAKASSARNAGLIIAITLAAVLWLSGTVLSPGIAYLLGDASLAFAIMIGLLTLVPTAIHGTIVGQLNGLRKFRSQSFVLSSQLISRLAFVVVFVLIGGTILDAIMGYLAASVVGAIAAATLSQWRENGTAKTSWHRITALAWPITLTFFGFNAILSIDLFFIKSTLLGQSDLVGYYAAASLIARTPYFIIGAFSGSIFPILASYFGKGEMRNIHSTVKDWLRRVVFLLAPLLAIGSIMSGQILALLFPPAYGDATSALSILIIGLGCFSLFTLLENMLIAVERYKEAMLIVVAVVVNDVAMNAILVPQFGLLGAAIATTLSSILGLGLSAACTIRYIGAPMDPKEALLVGFLAVLIGCLAFLLTQLLGFNFVIVSLLSLFLYFILAYALGLTSKRELVELRRMVLPSS